MSTDWSQVAPEKMFAAAMQVWYECDNCGRCCIGMNGISLNSVDTERMAKFLGMKKNDFIRQYTIPSTIKPTDRWYKPVGDDHRCPFKTNTGCTKYEGRGQVCRYFPFYSMPIVDGLIKQRKMILYPDCPGMKKAYNAVIQDSKNMPKEFASEILKQDIGKVCIVFMIEDEGKIGTVSKMFRELGFAQAPDRNSMKAAARLYATAYCAMTPRRAMDKAMASNKE
jgi:Fe-S-cluster containining protein